MTEPEFPCYDCTKPHSIKGKVGNPTDYGCHKTCKAFWEHQRYYENKRKERQHGQQF